MKERYLIINPGKPGQRKRKVLKRKNLNPSEGYQGRYWSFEGEPSMGDELLSQINFIKSKIIGMGNDLSPQGRRQIVKYLNQINEVFAKEMLK